MKIKIQIFLLLSTMLFLQCCKSSSTDTTAEQPGQASSDSDSAISKPLVSHIFTADPSAHVFGDKIYIYPSHDLESGIPANDNGDHFDMKDYHVLSLNSIEGEVQDHGVALDVKDVPWAARQLWAPDAAYHNGTYYLYFPAKDKADVFRIGVATSTSPAGPFKAVKNPIEGAFSIDPAVYKDGDGAHYIYFGGIWGGQLQRWRNGTYDAKGTEPQDGEPALGPRVARLDDNMLQLQEPPREIIILDENGKPILTKDHNRRFFEAAWMHKYNNKYYLSYSTGDTHYIVYAIGDSPYGPFTYQGVILNPVIGWTNHHSIVQFKDKWYLFYHDSQLSNGQTHLRNVKVTELTYNADGTIQTIDPYR